MARQDAPDLILMDINLPGMSGLEAMKSLQQNAGTRDIPVIALTAAAMSHDVKAGGQAGFKAYLTKPINVAETLEVINAQLARERTLQKRVS
jgi:CheY-like chemotaxis protein